VYMLVWRQLQKKTPRKGVTVRDSQEVHLVRSCSEPSHAIATAYVGALPVGPGTHARCTCPRFSVMLTSPIKRVDCDFSHVCTCRSFVLHDVCPFGSSQARVLMIRSSWDACMALSFRPQTMADMCDRAVPDRALTHPDAPLGEQSLN
jgi:hypothetical protein